METPKNLRFPDHFGGILGVETPGDPPETPRRPPPETPRRPSSQSSQAGPETDLARRLLRHGPRPRGCADACARRHEQAPALARARAHAQTHRLTRARACARPRANTRGRRQARDRDSPGGARAARGDGGKAARYWLRSLGGFLQLQNSSSSPGRGGVLEFYRGPRPSRILPRRAHTRTHTHTHTPRTNARTHTHAHTHARTHTHTRARAFQL